MEAKLRQLDAEKKELAEYQQHDRNRRSLEYAIYDKEVTDTRSKLQQASSSNLPIACENCKTLHPLRIELRISALQVLRLNHLAIGALASACVLCVYKHTYKDSSVTISSH